MKLINMLIIGILLASAVFAQGGSLTFTADSATPSGAQTVISTSNVLKTTIKTETVQKSATSTTNTAKVATASDLRLEKFSVKNNQGKYTAHLELKNTADLRVPAPVYIGIYYAGEIFDVIKREQAVAAQEFLSLDHNFNDERNKKLTSFLLENDVKLTARLNPFEKPLGEERTIVLRKSVQSVQTAPAIPTTAAVVVEQRETQNIQDTQIQKVQNPSTTLPGSTEPECDGCLYENGCLKKGMRIVENNVAYYCGESFEQQKNAGENCIYNYECGSNLCKDHQCSEAVPKTAKKNVVARFFNWLNSLFS
ncbi:MAG TPA: hypothetical protein VJJ79_00050 [Candidatus Nanoarchaeia archaeon]|nr:hypothetical protein [Candidatus Woesearchaeota archaeon]HLC22150.1 hypothetical protein [Candidatus Nanoarchaeia archaeon]